MVQKKTSVRSGDIAERSVRYTKDQFEQIVEDAERFVRANPVQSIGYALAAGFLLNRLPVGRILGGITKLLMIALKPAILIYGAMKLYQAASNDEK